jgi:hypothetical protein
VTRPKVEGTHEVQEEILASRKQGLKDPTPSLPVTTREALPRSIKVFIENRGRTIDEGVGHRRLTATKRQSLLL